MTEILRGTDCPNCGYELTKRNCVIISWGIKIVVLCGSEDKAVFYTAED